MMKRIISVLLAAVLIVGVLVITPVSASAKTANDYLTTGTTLSCVYTNSNGKKEDIKIKVPQLKLSSADAAEANKEIEQFYKSVLDASKKHKRPDPGVRFQSYLYSSVLSVCVDDSLVQEETFSPLLINIDVVTGKRMAFDTVRNLKGLNKEGVRKQLQSSVKADLDSGKSAYQKYYSTYGKTYYDTVLKSSNIDSGTKFYLDNSGNLWASYDVSWTTGNYPTNYVFLCYSIYTKLSSAYKLDTPSIKKLENETAGVRINLTPVKGAEKYRVFKRSGTSWTKIGDTASTSFVIKGVTSGTKYTYTVRCVSKDGKSFTSSYDTMGKSIVYIATPEVTKLVNEDGGIRIAWEKVAGAEKYRLFYLSSSGWKRFGSDRDKTSCLITNLSSGRKYTFTLRCVDNDGSFISSYEKAGFSLVYIAAPPAPTLKNTKSGVSVSWTKSNGAEKYRVFRKTAGTSWKKLADTASLKYTDKTAKSGTKYTYTVRCISKDGKKFTSGYNAKGSAITCKK